MLMAAAMSIPAFAQDIAADSIQEATAAGNDFRLEAPSKIVGGVSVVNVEQNQKKDHTIGALDNMQGFVGGWNGGSLWANDSDNDGGYLVLVDGVPTVATGRHSRHRGKRHHIPEKRCGSRALWQPRSQRRHSHHHQTR